MIQYRNSEHEQATQTQITAQSDRFGKKWHIKSTEDHPSCAGDHSKSEPPDPFPNSEVKPLRADGSVGLPM